MHPLLASDPVPCYMYMISHESRSEATAICRFHIRAGYWQDHLVRSQLVFEHSCFLAVARSLLHGCCDVLQSLLCLYLHTQRLCMLNDWTV